MSTKITIAYSKRKGKDFHLYKECFENDVLFIWELRHPEYYVASPDRVVVSKKIFNEILKVKT